ncbi:MAG: T9SS type A sorting domain-containing protein [Bacteroidetes bacterium]|nr:T9SS type A sorting domain-containing protein [Bacteroidota bacterium]
MKSRIILLLLLLPALAQAQNKSSRLIAWSWYNYSATFNITDSTTYYYTGDRGVKNLNNTSNYCDSFYRISYNSSTSVWTNNRKDYSTFDSHDNQLSHVYYSWDVPSTAWKGGTTDYYTYYNGPTADHQSSYTHQVWNVAQAKWLNSSRVLYFYNGDDLVDTTVSQTWTNPNWVNSIMKVYTYDALGNTILEYMYSWDAATSSWAYSRRDIYTYNGKLLATWIEDDYVKATSSWSSWMKQTYTYDASNNRLTSLQYSWDAGTSSWKNFVKWVRTYNSTNDMLSEIYQKWDVPGSSWTNDSRKEYTYDNNHNNLVYTESTWVSASSTWKYTNRETKTYNNYNQIVSYITDKWNAGGFWEYNNACFKYLYYYEEYLLGVNALQTLEGYMKLYPNPAANDLQVNMHFENPQPFVLQITDAFGRVVKRYSEQAVKDYSRTIVTSDLQNGTYYVQVAGANGKLSQQFIVTR